MDENKTKKIYNEYELKRKNIIEAFEGKQEAIQWCQKYYIDELFWNRFDKWNEIQINNQQLHIILGITSYIFEGAKVETLADFKESSFEEFVKQPVPASLKMHFMRSLDSIRKFVNYNERLVELIGKVVEDNVLGKPLEESGLPMNIVSLIKESSNCLYIRDLWVITPKELCTQLGATKNELEIILKKMEEIALKENKEELKKHIERSKQALSLYEEYMPKERTRKKAQMVDNEELYYEPEYQECEIEYVKPEYKQISIDELDLGARSYNCLKRAQIHNVYDLLKFNIDDLRQIRNLGRKSLEEIVEKLSGFVDKLPAGYIFVSSLNLKNEVLEVLCEEYDSVEKLILADTYDIARKFMFN